MMRYDNLMMSLTLRCLGITNRGFMASIPKSNMHVLDGINKKNGNM